MSQEGGMRMRHELFSNRPKLRHKERAQLRIRRQRSKVRDFGKGKGVHGKVAPWGRDRRGW